jgi:hypothetical protein
MSRVTLHHVCCNHFPGTEVYKTAELALHRNPKNPMCYRCQLLFTWLRTGHCYMHNAPGHHPILKHCSRATYICFERSFVLYYDYNMSDMTPQQTYYIYSHNLVIYMSIKIALLPTQEAKATYSQSVAGTEAI